MYHLFSPSLQMFLIFTFLLSFFALLTLLIYASLFYLLNRLFLHCYVTSVLVLYLDFLEILFIYSLCGESASLLFSYVIIVTCQTTVKECF
jgi:hypothetical protein